MLSRFRQRSSELEHLDKGDYTPEEYEGCITELQLVNRWLGDTSALRKSLFPLIAADGSRPFSVLDVGAGSGELLATVEEWSEATDRLALLVGLEYNERSARAIAERSHDHPQIAAVQADAFSLPFEDKSFDYVICSLFLHHFFNDQVISIFGEMSRVARKRVCVIDLHRHPAAWYLFRYIAPIFLKNRLIREDGALSILRSFTPPELNRLAKAAGLCRIETRRRFPFRLTLTAEPAINRSKEDAMQTTPSI
jgi:ubiquinone/menaquinone biosynthesis C-methylase UbiE